MIKLTKSEMVNLVNSVKVYMTKLTGSWRGLSTVGETTIRMAGGDRNSAEKVCDGGCSGQGSESTKTGTVKVTVASTATTVVVNGLRRRKTAAVAGSGNGDSRDQSRRQGYRSTRRRTANSTGQMEVVIGTPVGRNLARKQTAGKLRGGRGRRR